MHHVIVGKSAQNDVNHLGNVADVDAAIAIHVTHLERIGVRNRRFWLLILGNAEGELRQVESERVVLSVARELVGMVIIALLGRIFTAQSHVLAAVARGAITVTGIEDVPIAVLAVGKDKPHRAVDVGGQRIDTTTLVHHLDTASRVPVTKGDVADNIDGGLCRQNRQHKRHDSQIIILLHLEFWLSFFIETIVFF